jgi:hypothetical protein
VKGERTINLPVAFADVGGSHEGGGHSRLRTPQPRRQRATELRRLVSSTKYPTTIPFALSSPREML